MFTNEFGQTVKADWVSFSITLEQLSNLSSVVVRSIVRNSSLQGNVLILENENKYGAFNITGVETLEEVDAIHQAFGLDIYGYDEDSGELIFNDEHAALVRVLHIMFGESATYYFDADGDFIIEMAYEDYMRKSLGI